MLPLVIKQPFTLTDDLIYGLTKDWDLNESPSDCIDWGGWLKSVSPFRTKSWGTPWNHKVLFLDKH